MIRKFIHWDYYVKHNPDWAQAVLLREHSGSFTPSSFGLFSSCCLSNSFQLAKKNTWKQTDHCLAMLLETLLCRADTSLVTYHWVKGYDGPIPDFSILVSSIRTLFLQT